MVSKLRKLGELMEYAVIWKIDIDAESPREAAEIALKIQRDPFSTATVFEVSERDSDESCLIDLEVAES